MINSIIQRINWVDILIVILLFKTSLTGMKKGLWVEFFKFLGCICALILSYNYSQGFAVFLSSHTFLTQEAGNVIAFICLGVIGLYIFIFLRFLTGLAMKVDVVKGLNKYGGLGLGFIRGLFFSGLVLGAINQSTMPYLNASINENSSLGPHILKLGIWVGNLFSRIAGSV